MSRLIRNSRLVDVCQGTGHTGLLAGKGEGERGGGPAE